MSMTITQAQAVATLQHFLLRTPAPNGAVPSGDEASAALLQLVDRASKTLMVGLAPPDFDERWDRTVLALTAIERGDLR